MQVVHAAMTSVAVLGMLGGCPASPSPTDRDPDPPPRPAAPTDVERTEDEALPPEAVGTPVEAAELVTASLADLVADVALVSRGELSCSDGLQCIGTASWANCDYGTPKVAAGDELRVVTPEGVEDMVLVIEEDDDEVWVWVASRSKPGERTDTPEMGLALRNARPAATARLEERRLEPKVSAAEAKAVREWLDKPLEPVGAIEGTFGGGVDRILVFAPKRLRPFDELDDDEPPDHDVAVLVAGGELRGILPFGEVTGLEVVEVVDLDGDGTQELVWISQPAIPQLVTNVSISYLRGAEFVIHELLYCAYSGCDAILPAEKCGRSHVQWKKEFRR